VRQHQIHHVQVPLALIGVGFDVQEVCGDHDYAEPAAFANRTPPKTGGCYFT
jgi:hypothetical protein